MRNNNINTSFLKTKREEKGISQKDLAEMIETSPQNICDVEKGRHGLSLKLAWKVANILNDGDFDVEDLKNYMGNN